MKWETVKRIMIIVIAIIIFMGTIALLSGIVSFIINLL
jgi:hypothetical protein